MSRVSEKTNFHHSGVQKWRASYLFRLHKQSTLWLLNQAEWECCSTKKMKIFLTKEVNQAEIFNYCSESSGSENIHKLFLLQESRTSKHKQRTSTLCCLFSQVAQIWLDIVNRTNLLSNLKMTGVWMTVLLAKPAMQEAHWNCLHVEVKFVVLVDFSDWQVVSNPPLQTRA